MADLEGQLQTVHSSDIWSISDHFASYFGIFWILLGFMLRQLILYGGRLTEEKSRTPLTSLHSTQFQGTHTHIHTCIDTYIYTYIYIYIFISNIYIYISYIGISDSINLVGHLSHSSRWFQQGKNSSQANMVRMVRITEQLLQQLPKRSF